MLNQDEKTTNNSKEDESISFIVEKPFEDDINTIFFTGDVTEESANRLIIELVECSRIAEDKEDAEDIKIYLNTEGGSAYEMFAIYDIMQKVKSSMGVSVIGIGKIMSAGVLLLAAGTKGKRKIGKHSRVMIHNVVTGQSGAIHTVEHELKEVKRIQKMYIECLAENSDLTIQEIRRLLKKNENVYISAEQAVEYGIADEIL
jgi:ATP-dependent Clp protease protease subunit